MPRPKKEAGAEPKKRSRTGCWPCKGRKVKCGEEKPVCANCVKSGETCDYSIRLNWAGRSRKDGDASDSGSFTFVATPSSTASKKNGYGHEHVFSAQHIATAPTQRPSSRPHSSHASDLPTPEPTPSSEGVTIDPRLRLAQQKVQSPELMSAVYSPGQSYQHSINSAHQSPNLTERTPPTSAPSSADDFRWSPQHGAKRVKLNSPPPRAQPSPNFAVPQFPIQADHSPISAFTPHTIGSLVNTPATPGSSINSGSPYLSNPAGLSVHDPPDLRRLSVKSLLSDPSDEGDRRLKFRTYGYDHGIQDLDRPRNDDFNVVLPRSPDMRRASTAVSEVSTSSNEIDAKQIAFEPGGYYAHPVPIRISRALEPLPAELLGNQMNLLYFHHFINHTGRIMVPHDCPENPFRTVLPQMAVRNTHLLHLLLVFSASHRSKLLDHPEPANRIAEWMADVVPAMRQALAEPQSPGAATDPTDPSSLAPLATAIMLASMEIMIPNAFGAVRIQWQRHLQIARQLIVAKGGLHHLALQADGARDKAIFFLSRWFAYLDVMGSLSNRHEQPLFGAYLEDGGGLWLVNRNDEEVYQIDCFFGFSGRCISLLAQVAELSAQCDNERIDPITNQVKAGWKPSEFFRQQAEDLTQRLYASAHSTFRGCMHTDSDHVACDEGKDEGDAEEIYATNEAYHWAGIIHLSRRVLALPSSDPQVQNSVSRILNCLTKVRSNSTAESCLLFPIFSAGCEALHESQRMLFMNRLKAVEGWGMGHIGQARMLMQTVWDTGKPWELLVEGEFFG